jgi:uncharacterized protein
MTPEERSLVTDLFDRLAKFKEAERDPEAERAISDGLRRAPNAVYALVQTTLVQDEALKRANANIRDLEAQLGKEPQRPRSESFLDSRREAPGRRGSVPTARPGDAPTVAPADYRSPPLPMSAGPGSSNSGGSFLGTAAATAAGMIGGSLMLDSVRSMMGQRQGVGGFGATRPSSGMASGSGTPRTAPAGSSEAAREADHHDTRSGDDVAGSTHGDQVGDYQDDDDLDTGSGDFDEGSGDFDDGSSDDLEDSLENFDDDGGDFGDGGDEA